MTSYSSTDEALLGDGGVAGDEVSEAEHRLVGLLLRV